MTNTINGRTAPFVVRSVCSLIMLAGVPFDAHAQAWDPLTTLNADINSTYAGPVIDSLGNAWVVINDSVNLSVVGSKGTSGAWGAPFLLGPWIADGGFAA